MELDARTLVYFVITVFLAGGAWVAIKLTVNWLGKGLHKLESVVDGFKEDSQDRYDKLDGKIDALHVRLDRKNRREETRYRKIGMALTAMRMALPASNPHGAELSKLVDSLADENGDT